MLRVSSNMTGVFREGGFSTFGGKVPGLRVPNKLRKFVLDKGLEDGTDQNLGNHGVPRLLPPDEHSDRA